MLILLGEELASKYKCFFKNKLFYFFVFFFPYFYNALSTFYLAFAV